MYSGHATYWCMCKCCVIYLLTTYLLVCGLVCSLADTFWCFQNFDCYPHLLQWNSENIFFKIISLPLIFSHLALPSHSFQLPFNVLTTWRAFDNSGFNGPLLKPLTLSINISSLNVVNHVVWTIVNHVWCHSFDLNWLSTINCCWNFLSIILYAGKPWAQTYLENQNQNIHEMTICVW